MAELTPRDDARRLDTPPLQGRGRGWGLSAGRIAELGDRAAAMRGNPTEPEKRLWRHLSNSQLDGHKFRRQAVIHGWIADFLCPRKGLIVKVDGDTHEPVADARRDAALAALGYRVVRVTNGEVMGNMDGVLRLLRETLETMPDRRAPHPNPSPEGEGPELAVPFAGRQPIMGFED
ncbi:endonuclease domain-containing protein [Sphingomonas fennica]